MTSLDDNSIGAAGSRAPAIARQHYGITFAVLTAGAMSFALLQSLVVPALPEIQRDLNTTTTAITWVLTAYLLSASVCTPIVGRLGDMFGKERTLVASLAVMGLGTALAALADNIALLIVARAVQGVGGAIFPLAFGIIRDEFPRERVAHGIAMLSATLGIGSGIGIVLAGPIVDALSYHWLFWLPLIVIAAATVATILFVPESPIKAPGPVDLPGAALLAGGLVGVLVAISQGPSWGWGDARTLGILAAGLLALAVWIAVEERVAEPLVDMAMMRLRGVWTVNAAAFMVGASMYSALVLIPQFTAAPASKGYGFGASVTAAGLFLLPSTAMMLVVSPIAGRLTSVVGARVPLILGSAATGLGMAMLAVAHDQRWEIYVSSGVVGIGIALTFASLANLIVEVVRPDQTGVATGVNTVMRTIGGAVGSAIGGSVIAASVVGGHATEHGFTIAFAIGAGAGALATLASFAVPRPARLAASEPVSP